MHVRLNKLYPDDFDQRVSREGKYLTYTLTGEVYGIRIIRAKAIIRSAMTIPVAQDGFEYFQGIHQETGN